MIAINNNSQKLGADSLQLTPLPHSRPLLAIGHGTKNDRGRQTFLEFVATYQQEEHTEIEFVSLPEMGIASPLLQVIRSREIEAQLGQVAMNCEMCKFRLAATNGGEHGHGHGHHHHHRHHHHHENHDPYAKLEDYHQRIWKTP